MSCLTNRKYSSVICTKFGTHKPRFLHHCMATTIRRSQYLCGRRQQILGTKLSLIFTMKYSIFHCLRKLSMTIVLQTLMALFTPYAMFFVIFAASNSSNSFHAASSSRLYLSPRIVAKTSRTLSHK